jgi:protein SCO1/2
VITLTLAACDQEAPAPKFQANDVTGSNWGRDFELIDQNGAPRSMADYRGKVVLVFFGYTHCPDECPTTLAKMAQAVNRLGLDGDRVQGVFVTVDPSRDTPAVLAQYVQAFHPKFVGLTANRPTIAATAKEFKVSYDSRNPDKSGIYIVDHNTVIFVFDGTGRLRLLTRADMGVNAMVHDLNLLLQEIRQ